MLYHLKRNRRICDYYADSNEPAVVDGRPTTVDMANSMNYVQLGNPNLGQAHSHTTTFDYTRMWLRQQATLAFKAEYTKNINPVATKYRYGSATGGYELMLANVKGGEDYHLGLDYDQGIGVYLRLKNKTDVYWGYKFGYMTAVDSEAAPGLNRQGYTSFADDLNMSYESDNMRLSLYCQLQWNRYRYTDAAYDNSPLYINYGVSGNVTIARFKIGMDIHDEFRTGYMPPNMNRHRLVCDPRISYSFSKKKCRLALVASDVFNQLRSFESLYDAYQLSEKWSESLHHYIGVEFSYRFDAKAKK